MSKELLEHDLLSNYYGGICLEKNNESYAIYVDGYAGSEEVKISKELYEMMKKELFTKEITNDE